MQQSIKSMKLYHQVERIYNDLRALGVKDDDPLSVEQLSTMDQYHYLGTEAVDAAISQLNIGPDHRVLEVGSGIGGPARYLAHKAGCHVTALELQPDLDTTAQTLTRRCGLADLIDHVCGDMLDESLRFRDFDTVVSWLAFLHIPDRTTLLERCRNALKPGGGIYIEDFHKRGEFSAMEQQDLSDKIYCEYVPTLEEYCEQIETAGFTEVQAVDMTEVWTSFVRQRGAEYLGRHERNLAVHGEELVEALEDFYATVVALYGGGNLGGARIIARKP